MKKQQGPGPRFQDLQYDRGTNLHVKGIRGCCSPRLFSITSQNVRQRKMPNIQKELRGSAVRLPFPRMQRAPMSERGENAQEDQQ